MAADGHFDIVALVTGGGTGVGRAICLQLAARGARVAVNYSRSAAEAQQTADEARAAGGEAVTLQADIADVAAADGLVAATVERFGRLDFLVNNAGTTRFVDYRDLDALDDALWDRLYAVNVKGAFYCARAAAATMRRTGGGSIVNVASVSGLTGSGSSIFGSTQPTFRIAVGAGGLLQSGHARADQGARHRAGAGRAGQCGRAGLHPHALACGPRRGLV